MLLSLNITENANVQYIIYDFLLAIYSNCLALSTRFRETWVKNHQFYYTICNWCPHWGWLW